MLRPAAFDLSAATSSYQALIEHRRAVAGRLDADPWDADLRELHDDLHDQVGTARRAMEVAWLERGLAC